MNTKRLAVTLVLLFTPGFLLAARPSINELNTRVNQLEADVNQLDSRVTTNESDINANSTLIDDNTNRINALKPSVSVRANGERIGTYLDTTEDASSGAPTGVMVMNDLEYIFRINQAGELRRPERASFEVRVVYTTDNCTDQGYFRESDLESIKGLGSLLKGSGYVFDNAGAIYYSPISTTPLRAEGRSFKTVTNPSCQQEFFSRTYLYPIFPNDPAVTGVSTSSFALPLSLGF